MWETFVARLPAVSVRRLLLIGSALALMKCATALPLDVCRGIPLPDVSEVVMVNAVTTSRMAGRVLPKGADQWSPESEPSLQLWSTDRPPITLHVAVDGTVESIQPPPGSYCFIASARGYAAVMGRVRIDGSKPVTVLDVRLSLGV
jgi:hypothetical protein